MNKLKKNISETTKSPKNGILLHKISSPQIKTRSHKTKPKVVVLNNKTTSLKNETLKEVSNESHGPEENLLTVNYSVIKDKGGSLNVNKGVYSMHDNYENVIIENKKLQNKYNLLEASFEILSPAWVLDDTISLYFDIMMAKVVGSAGKIYLVNPVIAHAVKVLDDFEAYLDPLLLHDKEIIVFPINDNPDGYRVGGSHWSVLLYSKPEARFYYYDSLNNFNYPTTKTCCEKLSKYFSLPGNSKLIPINGPT